MYLSSVVYTELFSHVRHAGTCIHVDQYTYIALHVRRSIYVHCICDIHVHIHIRVRIYTCTYMYNII